MPVTEEQDRLWRLGPGSAEWSILANKVWYRSFVSFSAIGYAPQPGVLAIHAPHGTFHIKAGVLELGRLYFAAKTNAMSSRRATALETISSPTPATLAMSDPASGVARRDP